MSERETAAQVEYYNDLIDGLRAENASIKEELERRQKVINDTVYLQAQAEARVSELQAKLADATEHAEYEQRRADGAVAELVEVHAKLAEARHQCVGSCFK
jgi:chromosome segregation ATPase